MIFYFTGTGNSLWVAKTLGKELNENVKNIADYRDKILKCEDTVIGFVFPTYMSDIPWFCKKILLSADLNHNSYLFLVMTSSGGQSGASFSNMDKALCSAGCLLSAAFDMQMPGNCIVSSEADNSSRLSAAPEKVKSIAESVKGRVQNFKTKGVKANSNFTEDSYFYGNHSLKRLTFMKGFKVNDKCNGCGICASICPTDNITIKNGIAVHGDKCAACYACLHWCPEYATHLTVPFLSNRPQYHHPEIDVSELLRKKIQKNDAK